MDRFRAMQMVLAIADRGSLTAAAEELDTSAPSVVRGLAALEAALGARLFHRTTRRVSLTEEGRDYVVRCRRVLAEIDEAEAAVASRQLRPSGLLRVTAPVMFGRLHVAPLVTELLVKEPALRVEMLLADRMVDLVDEGVDLAVRIGKLPDSSLVAVNVGSTRRVLCASPAYLKRKGVPREPADLAHHACVRCTSLASTPEWEFGGKSGVKRVAIDGPLVTNQVDAALEACVRGLGIGLFLSYQVERAIKDGALRRVLEPFERPPAPIHIVRPQSLLVPARVRAFLDFVTPRLRARDGK